MSFPDHLQHVQLQHNPADANSRGISNLEELRPWVRRTQLLEDPEREVAGVLAYGELPARVEVKRVVICLNAIDKNQNPQLIFSSDWMKLLEVVECFICFESYLLCHSGRKNSVDIVTGPLRHIEIKDQRDVARELERNECADVLMFSREKETGSPRRKGSL
ncbi:hypothetical protein FGIG_03691 [Fasciola gigantica]|uniref:Uncharacterized protein n=1 Tax=Fasciola gigantica TaxID=46835 RepID=A0A504YA99_FASGI|nr:hypothetical protein FGIG_03691 [Fasciola gigantica]